jgi:hypothetical protein
MMETAVECSETLYVYSVGPIDNWFGWSKLRSFKSGLHYDANEFHWFWAAAQKAARECGWEGDIREGPYIAAIPGDSQQRIIISWKQANNGTTFVISPVMLRWLEPV